MPFFSPQELAGKIDYALSRRAQLRPLGEAARRTVLARYDLGRVCLPAQLALAKALLDPGSVRAPKAVASPQAEPNGS